MPYIKIERRIELNTRRSMPEDAGELNYLFTTIANEYLTRKGVRYQHINDLIGALEGAKLELYRRVAVPYEDKKKEENRDVYSCI